MSSAPNSASTWRWPDFVRGFGEIAGRYGFRVGYAGEGQGGRSVNAGNGVDELDYGEAKAGSFSGHIECHLRAAAKVAGPPTR